MTNTPGIAVSTPTVAIIGPSASGKSSVVRELARRGLVTVHPTWTTRPRRADETEGSDPAATRLRRGPVPRGHPRRAAHGHRSRPRAAAGLYVGFIARILLKDFRDVRGDALFGKRTFLVRHGRRATCGFSVVCWLAGAAVVPVVRGATVDLAHGLFTVLALVLLRSLSVSCGARRDEALVSAIALVGRSTIVTSSGICRSSTPAGPEPATTSSWLRSAPSPSAR